MKQKRCDWANGSDLLQSYHDDEWGVEIHDDSKSLLMASCRNALAFVIAALILSLFLMISGLASIRDTVFSEYLETFRASK